MRHYRTVNATVIAKATDTVQTFVSVRRGDGQDEESSVDCVGLRLSLGEIPRRTPVGWQRGGMRACAGYLRGSL